MLPNTFEKLVQRTRLRENASKMAYRVLVDGLPIQKVADEFNVSYQCVSQAVKRVSKAIPEGYTIISVIVPEKEAPLLEQRYRVKWET